MGFVQHGEFMVDTFPSFEKGLTHTDLMTWFDEQSDGHVEGIVWHAEDGKMFKLHRQHLGLKWPIDGLRIFSHPVSIDMHEYEVNGHNHNSLFEKLKTVDGKTFKNIAELTNWSLEKS